MRNFCAVVLKGMVEHGDPGAYFGSTLALSEWVAETEEKGWIAGETVTPAGHQAYKTLKLDTLPKRGRAAEWRDP